MSRIYEQYATIWASVRYRHSLVLHYFDFYFRPYKCDVEYILADKPLPLNRTDTPCWRGWVL